MTYIYEIGKIVDDRFELFGAYLDLQSALQSALIENEWYESGALPDHDIIIRIKRDGNVVFKHHLYVEDVQFGFGSALMLPLANKRIVCEIGKDSLIWHKPATRDLPKCIDDIIKWYLSKQK